MLIADCPDVNLSSATVNDPEQDNATLTQWRQDLVDEMIDHHSASYDYSAIENTEELSIMCDLFSTVAFASSSLISVCQEDTFQAFIAPDMLQQQQQQQQQLLSGSTVPKVTVTAVPQDKEPKRDETVKTKRKTNVKDNSGEEERRQRRLLKNRIAAKGCREKKKQHVQSLKEKIQQLEEDNEQLRLHVHDLKEKLAQFTQPNNPHLA